MQAELVALRVLEDDPVLVALVDRPDLGRAGGHGPLDRGRDQGAGLLGRCAPAAADGQVQMDPVLGRLGLGHALEEQPRPHAVGIDQRNVSRVVCFDPNMGQVEMPCAVAVTWLEYYWEVMEYSYKQYEPIMFQTVDFEG